MKRLLLACGILSSLFYLGTDILVSMRYEGYSYVDQTVSELSAIGAPTRALIVPLYRAYDVLLIAFAAGIRMSAGRSRPLRITAVLLAAIGLIGLVARVPMNVRGAERTLTDTMHLAITGVTILLFLLAVAFGTRAFGPRFRIYSIATFVTVLVSVVLAAVQLPKVGANLPTPWIGLVERISIVAYLVWVGVVGVMLLRRMDSPLELRHTEVCRLSTRAGRG